MVNSTETGERMQLFSGHDDQALGLLRLLSPTPVTFHILRFYNMPQWEHAISGRP